MLSLCGWGHICEVVRVTCAAMIYLLTESLAMVWFAIDNIDKVYNVFVQV